jgi:FtsH-binding integral membrane protein
MGMSMSTLFLRYTETSIATTFFATAGAFAGLSLYGYTTKRNLSAMGSFMTMGLIGIIIAMLLNLWLQSSGLSLAISILGVIIFAGLTAWDTQRLRDTYYHVAGTDMMGKVVILGALTLYLDFINMFQFLLSFLGNRE